ncbi:hypothetical protein FN846DRAFT_944125 [Sphaerosporella brunnea]|uniref:DUF676 domain-containing protein n=1 Tax=Sphaerosporella brunnea TaxID=1250544 RepID=A0A5J5EZV4_9PEZI|nr:hypothetical protein FN846DRAFT_944125 [Sphaerosporella brunnea]
MVSRQHPTMGRTLRISGIPKDITKKALKDSLESLLSDKNQRKGLIFSLVPNRDDDEQTATVTFERDTEPPLFAQCVSGRRVEIELDGVGEDLVVDCDFLGMTPLYSDDDPKVDIIAVTRLAGHAFGSWKSPTSGKMWLRDFLPIGLRGCHARILTFGYDSTLQNSLSSSSLQQFSRQLLDATANSRASEKEKHRPLIFIGHSIGGLVIKQALVEARPPHGSVHDQAILESCTSLFFFGVPNKGLNETNLVDLLKGQPNADFVNDLREGSAFLDLAYDSFLRGFTHDDCKITSFYEMQFTKTLVEIDGKWMREGEPVQMVTKDSATWASRTEALPDQVPLEANHSTLVKFSDRHDNKYEVVLGRIREQVVEAAEVIKKRHGHASTHGEHLYEDVEKVRQRRVEQFTPYASTTRA